MKITTTINRNMFKEYLPSKMALSLQAEVKRSIKSEDLVWGDNDPPRLTELALRVIASRFASSKILDELNCADKHFVLEILPTNLPLRLMVEQLDDGIYWKRRVCDRWKDRTNHVEDYGFNWKRMYMERHVQELVESFTPEGFDIDRVNEMCRLASDYVFKLDLRQLKIIQQVQEEEDLFIAPECFDHIDLSPIISGLKNLTELHIEFGLKHIGSNYKKSLFEMSNEDCKNIGEGVSRAENLKVLHIHQSLIDDSKVMSLLTSMVGNTSLKKFEITNCLISDNGALAIAKYLRGRSNLEELNLSNNKIGPLGIQSLAYVLTQEDTTPIKTLNLKFNSFGHDGFEFLASALIRDIPKVENLNLSCCNLDEESGILLGEMMKRNNVIRELVLSCNRFGEKGGRAIESGMEENKTITHLDLRMTEIPEENMFSISRNLHFNRIRAKKGEKGVLKEMQLIEERLRQEQFEEEIVVVREESIVSRPQTIRSDEQKSQTDQSVTATTEEQHTQQ
ncbi:UNVERIFIED_CONTAM: hypothetical protein PYX00_007340 [Menopon gallinae]|uniref:T-complex-associated testis-expressed protein 1 n=1 Tax=Menopon gallinae TaxID=328185 RepID=A0AAW2HIV7_9NEOP